MNQKQKNRAKEIRTDVRDRIQTPYLRLILEHTNLKELNELDWITTDEQPHAHLKSDQKYLVSGETLNTLVYSSPVITAVNEAIFKEMEAFASYLVGKEIFEESEDDVSDAFEEEVETPLCDKYDEVDDIGDGDEQKKTLH